MDEIAKVRHHVAGLTDRIQLTLRQSLVKPLSKSAFVESWGVIAEQLDAVHASESRRSNSLRVGRVFRLPHGL